MGLQELSQDAMMENSTLVHVSSKGSVNFQGLQSPTPCGGGGAATGMFNIPPFQYAFNLLPIVATADESDNNSFSIMKILEGLD